MNVFVVEDDVKEEVCCCCLIESFEEVSFLLASLWEDSFLLFDSSFFGTALIVDSIRFVCGVGDSFLLEAVDFSSIFLSLLLDRIEDEEDDVDDVGGGGGVDFLF